MLRLSPDPRDPRMQRQRYDGFAGREEDRRRSSRSSRSSSALSPAPASSNNAARSSHGPNKMGSPMPGAWAETPAVTRTTRAERTNGKDRNDALFAPEPQSFSVFDKLEEEFQHALDVGIGPSNELHRHGRNSDGNEALRYGNQASGTHSGGDRDPKSQSSARYTSKDLKDTRQQSVGRPEMGRRLADLVAKAEELKTRYSSPVRPGKAEQQYESDEVVDHDDREFYTPARTSASNEKRHAGREPEMRTTSRDDDDDRQRAREKATPYYTPAREQRVFHDEPELHSRSRQQERRVSEEDQDPFVAPSKVPATPFKSLNLSLQRNDTRERLPGAFPDTPRFPPPKPPSVVKQERVPGAYPDTPYFPPAPSSVRRDPIPSRLAAIKTPSGLRNQVMFSPTDSSPFRSPASMEDDGRKVRFRSTVSERTISWASPASSRSPYREPGGPLFDEGSDEHYSKSTDSPSIEAFERYTEEIARVGGLAGSPGRPDPLPLPDHTELFRELDEMLGDPFSPTKERSHDDQRVRDEEEGHRGRRESQNPQRDEEDEFWSTPRRADRSRSPSPELDGEIGLGELYARAVAGTAPDEDIEDVWGEGFVSFGNESVDLPRNFGDSQGSISVMSNAHSDSSLLATHKFPETARPPRPAGLPPLARGGAAPPKSPSTQQQRPPGAHATPSLGVQRTPTVLPSPGTFFASKSGPIGALEEESGVTPSQRPQFYTPETAGLKEEDGTPTSAVLQTSAEVRNEDRADTQAFFANSQDPCVPVISIKAATPSAFVLSPPPPVPDGPVEIRHRAAGWTTTPAKDSADRDRYRKTTPVAEERPQTEHPSRIPVASDRPPASNSTNLSKHVDPPKNESTRKIEARSPDIRSKPVTSPRPRTAEPDRSPRPAPIRSPPAKRMEHDTERNDFVAPPATTSSAEQRDYNPPSSSSRDPPGSEMDTRNLERLVEGRNSLPKDATREQIARWLGTAEDDRPSKTPSRGREQTFESRSPLSPVPASRSTPARTNNAASRIRSPEPVDSPAQQVTHPIIVLPESAFTSGGDRTGTRAPLALVSIRAPATSSGLTSRMRCIMRNPGLTNAAWMMVKVGSAKAHTPDMRAGDGPILVEEEVFRWSEEKGVIPRAGEVNEVSLRLAFLPSFIGRYQQTFHVRCRGRIVELEVVGVAVTKSGIGLDAKRMFELPSTLSAPERELRQKDSERAKAALARFAPPAASPETPLQNHPRIRDHLKRRAAAADATPARVPAPLERSAVDVQAAVAEAEASPKLWTLEILRRPSGSDPPLWRPHPTQDGEVIQVFDLGTVPFGETSKMTMRACNQNQTSVLIKAVMQGRDAKSFVLPFRTLLVPRESFVPFPIVFQPTRTGSFEQEVILTASGGGGHSSLSIMLVGTATV